MFSIAALAACSKSGGTSLNTRLTRGAINNNNFSANGSGFNTSSVHWGCIYNNNSQSFSPILQQFMPDVTDLGQVNSNSSSCSGNSTGVLFAGQISMGQQTGQVEMVIIDQECATSNGTQCYAPVFTVSPGMSVSGNNQSYGNQFSQTFAQVVAEDSYGAIILRGNIGNDPSVGQNAWEGEIDFANNSNAGGYSGVFGNFVIPAGDILNN